MTYEDYENRLTAILQKPDDAPLAVQALLKEIKADTDSLTSLKAVNEEQETRIRSLQDTNAKLVLQVLGKDTEKESAPDFESMEEGPEKLEAYMKSLEKGD